MRDKATSYLQQHLSGELTTSEDVLRYFSTDASILKIKPKAVIYPKNAQDVRKIMTFCWQLAERGLKFSITARGKGTDLSGAALGEGIILVFPAHMNRIIDLDENTVTVEPGLLYAKLQQALHTHYRFIPPYPASIEFASIGGSVANNASGEKTVKYGDTRQYTKALAVVLANGEQIFTRSLSHKELNHKKGLTTFEGKVYRELDGLIDDNKELINIIASKAVTKNSAGYALHLVKSKNSFDLTPLFVGSQGTLGIITRITLKTAPYNPRTSITAAYFDDLFKASEGMSQAKQLEPSAIEVVDSNLLDLVAKNNPALLPDSLPRPFPKIVALIEFDDAKAKVQKVKLKKLKLILSTTASDYDVATSENEREELWKIRHSAAVLALSGVGSAKAVPIVEDGVVPPAKLSEYIEKTYQLFKRHNLEIAIWGHGGDANLHMQPFFDLATMGDRQRLFKLADDYYKMLADLGGSSSGEHGDGRLRAPYLPGVYGEETYALFEQVKRIFDPHNILNTGVKFSRDKVKLQQMLRTEYSMEHLYDHLPRM